MVAMKILEIETNAFHTINYRSSGPRRQPRHLSLPCYRVQVDSLPQGMHSVLVSSDLQGREIGPQNRLLGEVLAEDMARLSAAGQIPTLELALLAGDLYAHPGCQHLGCTGDVTSVWQAFAQVFSQVVGVQGNHDQIRPAEMPANSQVLDGDVMHYQGLTLGGVSGIIGRRERHQRKSDTEFAKALLYLNTQACDVLILHQGPDDPEREQLGSPLVRRCLEKGGDALVVFGHCYWQEPWAEIAQHHILNVDQKVFLLTT